MKRQKLHLSILTVALATCGLLLVPWVAMMVTDAVDWSASDFILAGLLLFGTGLSFVLVIRSNGDIVFRIAIAAALGTALFMVWANLAVGLIGSGPNPGNIMYIGVVFVGIIAAVHSQFRPKGMERASYASALAVLAIAAIALLTGMQHYPGSSVTEILGVNGFFAATFGITGLLFRHAKQEQDPTGSQA